jgi:SAM-dependent methyltransferase
MIDSLEENRIRAVYGARKCGERSSLYNPGNLFILQEKEREMLTLLGKYGLAPLHNQKIMDIGCGTGYWTREFIKWGAEPENIMGVDLMADRINLARKLCAERVTFLVGNAAQLEISDATFDIVLVSTVFSSILDKDVRKNVASEMLRILKPEGIILWYDSRFDNPRNPNVRAVKKKELCDLFPNCRIELRRITLAPPLCRLLAPYSILLCSFLSKIPFLLAFYVGAISKITAD